MLQSSHSNAPGEKNPGAFHSYNAPRNRRRFDMFGTITQRRIAAAFAVAIAATTFAAWAWANAPEEDLAAKPGEAKAAGEYFDKSVAPLLASRCLECHNASELKGKLDLTAKAPALRGGENGVAIVSGNPDESLLWQYVDSDEMPPKKPLAPAEKEIFRKWIADGANWGTDPIDRFAFTSDARAGYDWWSLQPVKRPELPATISTTARGPVDAFIAAKREAKGLRESPAADRRVLIRRLSFDLLGLPPTPAEVEAFAADATPDAYERLVDRMLASPHYGERWGRFWLDVVRFGESDGYEYDKLRANAWPFRDWVISALNQDMPYDEFVRLQLAGDVLRSDDAHGIVATGFLVAGPHDGLKPAGDVMQKIMRQDELEDVVGVIGQTFLGLTVHCARCHDHKFDPIRQVDYYRLTSAVAGYSHGEREVPTDGNAAAMDVLIAAAQRKIRELEEPARQKIIAERSSGGANADQPPVDLKPLAAWDFAAGLDDLVGDADGKLSGDAEIAAGSVRLDGKSGFVATAALPKDVREKTITALVTLENLQQQGGAAISLQQSDGGVFDAIVFGELQPGRWMAGSNGFVRTKTFNGPEETEAASRPVHMAIVYRADGTIVAYRDGKQYGDAYQGGEPPLYPAGKSQVLIGLRHGPAGGNRLLAGAVKRAAIFDRALSADEVAKLASGESTFIGDDQILAQLSPDQRELNHDLKQELASLQKRRGQIQKQTIYTCVPQPAGVAHLLVRGNPLQLGEVVAPGGVPTLRGVNANFNLAPEAPESERRVKLATWITDPANPLFARVMVNRLWHYHFGLGLVDTPNDFGFGGSRPTHPELLDFLADGFVRGSFHLKQLHRTLVTSATYRQASAPSPDAMKIDAENRLLWRKSPMRLEAEVVRDAMLSAAGELNTTMGGPGFHDFRAYVHRTTQFYEPLDVSGPDVQRRTIYRTWARGGRNPFLDTLDCPDPSTTTPKRSVTTTPLQAMAMWNNAFVLRMADALAARVQREAGDEIGPQIGRTYELALSRSASPNERDALTAFVEEHGLSALCRVLLNSNEFMYVD